MEFKVVSFILGDEEFGVDIMKIDSIVEVGKITRIPESADYIEGIMNFRGSVIPVINLRRKFLMEDLDEDMKKKAKIIVVNIGERKVGMLVDDVREVLTINDEQMEEPPSEVGGVGRSYVLGIAKLEDKMLIILDVDKILTAEEQIELGEMLKSVT